MGVLIYDRNTLALLSQVNTPASNLGENAYGISADPTDDSWWVNNGETVGHYSHDGGFVSSFSCGSGPVSMIAVSPAHVLVMSSNIDGTAVLRLFSRSGVLLGERNPLVTHGKTSGVYWYDPARDVVPTAYTDCVQWTGDAFVACMGEVLWHLPDTAGLTPNYEYINRWVYSWEFTGMVPRYPPYFLGGFAVDGSTHWHCVRRDETSEGYYSLPVLRQYTPPSLSGFRNLYDYAPPLALSMFCNSDPAPFGGYPTPRVPCWRYLGGKFYVKRQQAPTGSLQVYNSSLALIGAITLPASLPCYQMLVVGDRLYVTTGYVGAADQLTAPVDRASGRQHCVYATGGMLYYTWRRLDGTVWSAPVAVGSGMLPSLQVAADGSLRLAYQASSGSAVSFLISRDLGGTWGV